jgi:tripeptidyl-peptidase-1
MRSGVIFRASLLASSSAWSLVDGAKLMSQRTSLPASVKVANIPSGDQIMTLQVALAFQNINQLEETLKAVSTPSSPDYGKYLDAEQVNEMFNPSPASRDAVMAWLKDSGVTDIADFGSYINFATTVSNANAMLNSRFQNYIVDGVQKLRTLQYSVPDDLADHIALISPTTFFGRTKAQAAIPPPEVEAKQAELVRRQTANETANCAKLIEPSCLESMYNYGSYKALNTSGSRVGFGSFLNQSALQKDLTLYQKAYNLPANNFTVTLINGGVDHQNPDLDFGEANLDSQFMMAVVKALPMTEFITAGKP